MNFQTFLNEAPIPQSWDKDKLKTFKDVIKYVETKAKKVGSGSSRVAFQLKHNGQDTVLKFAKNRKGIAQTEAEVEYMEDDDVKEHDILIPMIDYDTEKFKWIHTAYADKATESQFIKECGVELGDLIH